jgi:ABC-type branched-subunit amino acid transport system substrate-binding protein
VRKLELDLAVAAGMELSSDDSATRSGRRTLSRRRASALAICASIAAIAGAAAPGQTLAKCAHCRAAAAHKLLSLTLVIDQPTQSLLAVPNELIARGAAVAVAETNAQPGGLRVKLVSKSLDNLSASAMETQLRAVGADALILPCDTDSEYRLVANAAKYRTLMFAPCNPDPPAAVKYPTFWSVGVAGNTEAAGLADFMARVGYRRVLIADASGARYMSPLTAYFRAAAKTAGLDVKGSVNVSLSTKSFPAVVKAVEAENPRPSALFTALPPPYVNRLAAALAADLPTGRNISPTTVFGTTVMDSPQTLSNPAPEGAIFASYGFVQMDSAGEKFAADYQKAYHSSVVGAFPGLGFDTVTLIELAAQHANSSAAGAIGGVLAHGFAMPGVGLNGRTYTADGDHLPIAVVGVSKIFSGSVAPLTAILPTNVQIP